MARASPIFVVARRWARAIPLVDWPKPSTRPQWMTPQEYAAFPDELRVREVKVDGKVLVTTMLNARKVRKGELAYLTCAVPHDKAGCVLSNPLKRTGISGGRRP